MTWDGVSRICFRGIRRLVQLVYPKLKVVGAENLPEEACVLVANHAKMNGPIACELYMPGAPYTWCAGEMMHLKEVPGYAFEDFWRDKPGYIRWFYRGLSYVIALPAVCVFNQARTIGVYHDVRYASTLRTTLDTLEKGCNIAIMPEGRTGHDHIVNLFQEGFVDLAGPYYKRTGKKVCFVPVYIAPSLRQIHVGTPIPYCPDNRKSEERIRIRDGLMKAIRDMAEALPEHSVVPYDNMPKRKYPKNRVRKDQGE